MDNPNNCSSCDHKKHSDGGHCYMFRLTPTKPCAHHTVRFLAVWASTQQSLKRMVDMAVEKHGERP